MSNVAKLVAATILGLADLKVMGVNNRLDCYLYIEVRNGNPNGDPDQENRPRTCPFSGHGQISSVCLRHKQRVWVESTFQGRDGMAIYINPGSFLDDKHKDAYKELTVQLKRKPKDNELKQFMLDNYWDIRTNGGVMPGKKGLDCGKVCGPMQMEWGLSIDPLEIQNVTLSRCVQKNDKDNASKNKEEEIEGDSKNGTFGSRWLVPYALYEQHCTFNPMRVRESGFTKEDMSVFWRSLDGMFELDRTSARPYMELRRLIVFEHFNSDEPTKICTGREKTHRLEKMISVDRLTDQSPRCFEDYLINLDVANTPEGIRIYDVTF